MVAVFVEVSLSMLVKPTLPAMGQFLNCQEHISNGGSSLPPASIYDLAHAILTASDFDGREGFLPFILSSRA